VLSPTALNLATLAFILLLPLVPAFLLFKLLPSTAVVDGPLQGLRIDLSGAFAAYFALVVLVLSTHSVWNPPPVPPASQVWTVSGRVTDNEGNAIPNLNTGDFALQNPSLVTMDTAGNFKVTVPITFISGGAPAYPSLCVSIPSSYTSNCIPLDPGTPSMNPNRAYYTMNMTNPIQLQPLQQAYAPGAALNAQVNAGQNQHPGAQP
jgi:hypothetical protein